MNGAIIPVEIIDTDTVGQIVFTKRGNVVSFYGNLSNLSSSTNYIYGTAKSGFQTPTNTYAAFPLFSKTAPYNQTGTVWIDEYGRIVIYKPSGVTEGYVFGTYVTA